MGHRRWLDGNHKIRFQRTLFDDTEEYRRAPEQTIGSEILFMLKHINFSYGKMNQPPNTQTKRRSRDKSDEEDDPNENVCENIIGTILNVDRKSKDNLQSRLDLVDMRIRRDLHPQVLLNGKYQLSPSIFSMSKEEKEVFCMVLKDIKVPDAYASNISRCVSLKNRRLYSLKSRDYHILMQDLLPVALRCCMSKNVTSCIIELSNIMKAICGKVLDVEELEKVQDRAALTLCNLEKYFPPSFFTIMVHLVIHLPHEAILGGLVSSGKDVNDEVKWLSQGPNRVIRRYSAFHINGYRFHTKYRERMRRTQNCGIVVNPSITSYASARDSNLIEGKMRRRRLRDLSIVQNTPNSKEANSEQQTVVGSSNVSKTLDEPAEFQTKSGGTRRGRGRTLLKHLYDLTPIEHVKVSRNSQGQPIRSEARLLTGYLGIIARNANMLPINYKSWHHMPDSNKNQALDNIKERFALEVSDDYIKKALGKKWRDNKSTLKKQYFKKDIGLEEKLRNDRKLVGTRSRQKQKFTHTVGSRSFTSVAEAEEVSCSQKVGRLQPFEITHRKKDGSPMTPEAGEIMEKLNEKKAEYEAIASTYSSITLENIDNRIITEQYMPSGSQAQAEVQRLRDQIAQIAEAAQREAVTAAMEVAATVMAAKQSRKYDELQLQLQQMMQMFQRSQKPPS
ncbi:hypothetical protein CXB51_019124 [Gossypium anomalum]|uniref:DUF4218 domain-containing protein n=1 Tax=Gossypium anomalum TaxID=47600 RepID=A0A8J6CW73_9ROSI|nr:hypothetical protein CXB51_019124 [Gossypium anomalum]